MLARAIISHGTGKLIDALHPILVSTEAARFAILQPGRTPFMSLCRDAIFQLPAWRAE
jgi:hypothetical protein